MSAEPLAAVMGQAIAAGAALGLLSIPHCAGMCGPIATYAATGERGVSATKRAAGGRAGGYHVGRALAYVALGALLGGGGSALTAALPVRWASALFSFGLAAALGVAAWRLWTAGEPKPAPLVTLGVRARRPGLAERAAAVLPKRPLILGLLTGLLPCGALYAAGLLAAATAEPLAGAASMLAFAAVSGLGLSIVSLVAVRVRARIERGADARFLRRLLASALLVGAIVLAVRPAGLIREQGHEPATCHVDPS